MKYGPDFSENGEVKVFGHTIILGCVMDSELVDCPLFIKVSVKLSAQILAPSVSSKGFNLDSVLLSSCPCPVLLIRLEGFVLGLLEVQGSKLSMIISKTDIIFMPSFSSHWGWSSQFRMDLVTKGLGLLSHSLMFDWLMTGFCKFTGITVTWALRFVKFNPINNTLLD
jgi:hypothetical protein